MKPTIIGCTHVTSIHVMCPSDDLVRIARDDEEFERHLATALAERDAGLRQ